MTGIVKADNGIRRGEIIGIGKAGNPDIMDGVTPGLVTGPNTTVVHGDHHFVTACTVEAHAHVLSPQEAYHALAGGSATMIGMSPGPNFDLSCSRPHTLGRIILAADESRSTSVSSGAATPTPTRWPRPSRAARWG